MSKDARNCDLELTPEEKNKFAELVALLSKHGFGEAGPPRETTFAEIEQFGHRAGQMVARAIDAHLAEHHAEHFAGEEPCPTCGERHRPKDKPHREHQSRLGLPPAGCEKTDPRKLFAEAIGYFNNKASRMNYPEYRRQGLPTTSAHMESLVKEINARVKGTEKFWNDGVSGEAILQLRAAALCDDDRLSKFLHNRPGHPFHPNAPKKSLLSTAT